MQLAPGLDGQRVVWLDWPDYLDWLGGHLTHADTAWGERVQLGPPWEPGQHAALIGPTGCAKTTHAVGMLGLRSYVLALDPKGEDETLSSSGYQRVRQLPREDLWTQLKTMLGQAEDQRTWQRIHKDIDEGRPARVLVGGGSKTDDQDVALQELMRDAVTYSRHAGGWTLYVDEFELLSSQRMFRLGPLIERMLITARRDKTSVVTAFQAPAWVSKHATRQARLAVVWPQDGDMVKAIASGMGRDWRGVAEAVDQLPPFHTLTIPRSKTSGPMVITSAPKLEEARRGTAAPTSAAERAPGVPSARSR